MAQTQSRITSYKRAGTKRPKPRGRQHPKRSASRLGAQVSAEPQSKASAFWQSLRRLNWSKAAAVVMIIGSMSLLMSFFAGERFRVQDVQVTGATLVDDSQIVESVRLRGVSIFRVRPAALSDQIAQSFGFIEDASVACALPNAVTVAVHEHDTVLVWESAGSYWWVGRDGTVLGANAHPQDLTVIHDVEQSNTEPSAYVLGVPWQLAIDIAAELPGLAAYDYTVQNGLIIYVTAQQWPVYLGRSGDAVAKIAVLKELVNELSRRGSAVQFIDLRNEQRPTYTKR